MHRNDDPQWNALMWYGKHAHGDEGDPPDDYVGRHRASN